MVLGALAATFVVVNLAPTVDIYGARLNLQAAILDPLFPGALASGCGVDVVAAQAGQPAAAPRRVPGDLDPGRLSVLRPDHTSSTDPAAQYQVCTSALLHPYYALRRAAGADGSATAVPSACLRLADAGP